jgi:hypothetical protein
METWVELTLGLAWYADNNRNCHWSCVDPLEGKTGYLYSGGSDILDIVQDNPNRLTTGSLLKRPAAHPSQREWGTEGLTVVPNGLPTKVY